MTKINRRSMLGLLGSVPLAAGFTWTEADAAGAAQAAQAARRAPAAGAKAAFKPKFFTAHEYATVSVLVDIIIPKDGRSGSATDAGVPEFMDFMMADNAERTDQADRQTPMRGGLAWIDRQCEDRFDKRFLECSAPERAAVLDDIAWPAKAKPEFGRGVAFFNSFRDLTAAGFFSSKMGVTDLQYLGNVMVAEWKGCPDEALKKLGVTRLTNS
jgi:gluconate 2-dehydrogenase gamma chain